MRNLLPLPAKRWLVLPLLLTAVVISCKSFEEQRNELPDMPIREPSGSVQMNHSNR